MTTINQYRPAWLLLAITALGLELSALYFQYGMHLEPCVLCVYERAAIFLIILAGLFGAINPKSLALRSTGYLLWAGGVIWGLYLSVKHSGIQMGLIEGAASCEFVANFPPWMQLDQWIPFIFNPTGYCEDIQWQFLGMSMPQTMVVVNLVLLLVFIMVLLKEFKRPETF